LSEIVADTHAVLWYLSEPHHLSDAARSAFEQATTAGDRVFAASITLVEAQYLAERGPIPWPALVQLQQAVAQPDPTIALIRLDLAVSLAVARVPRAQVPDMPDRIIAATALHLGRPLVTRDRKIRAAQIETIW
jgi:PIN domain nuclease of toxin-antitoxin system